jgi:hydroxymethylpyrimidine pyrophosphatase-like HAD family hydrolase
VTVLIASDLDRTLIYSRAAAGTTASGAELVCVESLKGIDISFMTLTAAKVLASLADAAVLVPVTTRTTAQLQRVRLPGRAAPFAVAANGGRLFVEGQLDLAWHDRVTQKLREVASLAEVWAHLTEVCDSAWTLSLRDADGMFCYAVVDRPALPPGFVIEIAAWAQARGWTTSLQGAKLYWVPRPLTKSAAVAEIARRIDAELVLAAGDSLLDIDLLAAAGRGIHPAHGEIAASGWTSDHVRSTTTTGAQAGEDICRWLRDQVAEVATPCRRGPIR